MKIALIKLSELGTDCWSAEKVFSVCHGCHRVEYCKFPEAKSGRIRNAEKFLVMCQLKAVDAQERLDRIKESQ